MTALDHSMIDIFRQELDAQVQVLTENLLALEAGADPRPTLESLMRAAHSLKGAARVVNLELVADLAHHLETSFVSAQSGKLTLATAASIDTLLQIVDWFSTLKTITNATLDPWLQDQQPAVRTLVHQLEQLGDPQPETLSRPAPLAPSDPSPPVLPLSNPPAPLPAVPKATFTLSTDLPSFIDDGMAEQFLHEAGAATQQIWTQVQGRSASQSLNLDLCRNELQTLRGAAKLLHIQGLVAVSDYLEQLLSRIPLQLPSDSPTNSEDNTFVQLLAQLRTLPTPESLVSSDHARTQLETWLQTYLPPLQFLLAGSPTPHSPAPTPPALSPPRSSPLHQPTQISPDLLNLSGLGEPGLGESELREPGLPDLAELVVSTNSPVSSGTVVPTVVSSPAQINQLERASAERASAERVSSERASAERTGQSDRVVRVSASTLNRLMALAGETLVEANWLQPFADSLQGLRHQQLILLSLLDQLQESFSSRILSTRQQMYLSQSRQLALNSRERLTEKSDQLELYVRRSVNLSDRLYRAVVASNMCPFSDGTQGFPRLVRDVARQLEKQVRFEIIGPSTPIDRDILEKLEVPLVHLLQNAIDHGIELPAERLATGKAPEGLIRLEAMHRSGMLLISICDDGRGVDTERLRRKVVEKGFLNEVNAAKLTEAELIDFLFLPGFSTAQQVSQISGRGVGLDIVHATVQEVGGILRATSELGKGTTFQLQLPLTLSVIRTLLVEIAGEPYAFPLTRIDQIVRLEQDTVQSTEGRQYCVWEGRNLGLVSAQEVLGLPLSDAQPEPLAVVVISDRAMTYGIVVDRFLGEKDLVVRPLDPRLGKVPNISAAALMEDGAPILILDVEDVVRSIEKQVMNHAPSPVSRVGINQQAIARKRVLVVDDSLTVREVERKILENRGYEVEVAVNGMDGWNAVRAGGFDLVISDVDMPRMNGFEMVSRIKQDGNLQRIPVIIVSYKDREEDRLRGLEVGADAYLTKNSFQDNTLLQTVIDLIGSP